MSDRCRVCPCDKYRKTSGNPYQCKCDHYAAEHDFAVEDGVPASPPATGKMCPFCKHDPCRCETLDCRALGDNDLMRVPASPRAEPPEQYRQILEKLCPECYLAVSSVIAGGP